MCCLDLGWDGNTPFGENIRFELVRTRKHILAARQRFAVPVLASRPTAELTPAAFIRSPS